MQYARLVVGELASAGSEHVHGVRNADAGRSTGVAALSCDIDAAVEGRAHRGCPSPRRINMVPMFAQTAAVLSCDAVVVDAAVEGHATMLKVHTANINSADQIALTTTLLAFRT